MVVVIALTAILAAVAAPALSSAPALRAKVASRQLLRDLTYARQRAIATGTTVWVVFNASTESWSLLAESPASPGRAGASAITDMASGYDYTQTLNTGLFPGVEIVSVGIDSGNEIGFDWLGQPLNASQTALTSQAIITLSGSNTIRIEPRTGHVRYP
jgi:Tfp pilus assembly protein FimT